MSEYSVNFFRGTPTMPDRSGAKDKKYHLEMARYSAYSGMCNKHDSFIYNLNVNTEFFKGNQWIMKEDIDNFLKDENNQVKNRIKVVQNKLVPIIAQYLGNARAMELEYEVENLSPEAINRREEQLAKMLFFTEVARNAPPSYREFLKKQYPIGNSLEETMAIFDNVWTDEFKDEINKFGKAIVDEVRLESFKEFLALDLALGGIQGLMYDFYNGDYVVDRVDIRNFWFDHSCKKADLTDAMFMGENKEMSMESVIERYQPPKEVVDLLRKDAQSQDGNSSEKKPGRYIVTRSYWKDTEHRTFGYVNDPYGYPYLVELDSKNNDDEIEYTEKDLIPEDQLSNEQKKIFKGKNSGKIYVDVIRYCHFIPEEFLTNSTKQNKKQDEGFGDLVLEYGVLEHQETEAYRVYNVKFPYKMHCWYYIEGEVFTPVSQLISPQRFINRMSSVAENLINTSLPANAMYDPNMVEDEDEFLSNWYQGKPNAVSTKGLGINNLVSTVGGGIDPSVGALYEIQALQSNSMDKMIGVNESLRGENQGANKLVGVTALEIQRASLAQESFYGAIAEVYSQIYTSIVNVGRKVYAENERQLAIYNGDKGATILRMSKSYNVEDFRCVVKRQPNPEQVRLMGQQKLEQYVVQGIISKPIMAKYFMNPTDDNIGKALREQSVIDIETERMAAEQQQAAAAEQQQSLESQMAKLQQEQEIQESREDAYRQGEMDIENRKLDIKQNETINKLAANEAQKRQ